MAKKRCTKCGEEKDLEAGFSKTRAQCKACIRDRAARYYAANSRKICQSVMAYAAANREKVTRRQAAWAEANKTKVRQAQGRYYARHRDRILAKQADQYRLDPLPWQAHGAVSTAVRNGDLTILPCEECDLEPLDDSGRQRIEAHHHRGYEPEFWLDVRWLCGPCHKAADKALRVA